MFALCERREPPNTIEQNEREQKRTKETEEKKKKALNFENENPPVVLNRVVAPSVKRLCDESPLVAVNGVEAV